MDVLGSLGKPIGSSLPVGHTVPTDGFDQGEHGAGTGVSGGHVPSAANQAKGYGQGDHSQSGFNAGLGGQHASGGLTGSNTHSTPIADKFMGSGSHSHSHSHGTSSSDAVSGAYSGGGTRDALTGESNAHTTGAGVGVLAENLSGSHHTGHHSSSTGHHSSSTSGGAYDGSINRDTNSSAGHAHGSSARDAALTGTAGAAAATALGSGATGHSSTHGIQSGTGVGVGAVGGSGGHYSTEGQHGSGLSSGTHHASSHSSGQNYNTGTGTGAGVLAGQQASARGTHGSSGLTGSHGVGAGAAAEGLGAGAGAGAASSNKQSSALDSPSNSRGEPVINPKDLDSGSRHGLVFDKATGKYIHRHDLEESK